MRRGVGRPRQSAKRARDRAATRRRVIAGRYEVLERLGAGGTATVYRARDLVGGKELAIKVLHHMLSEDELVAERFRREARRAERLWHPNIVRTFDHGVWDGTHFITMEYLPGRSLKSLIASGGAPRPGDAVELILQVLEATRFIHEHGIIHRDLSSRNVIVDPHGRVKVVDFGIACTRATSVTPAGSLIGTIEYIAPERLKGESATEASDLYSIGVMLYELVTGLLPFDGELVSTVALKNLHEYPTPPSRLNAAVTPRLGAIVACERSRKRPKSVFGVPGHLLRLCAASSLRRPRHRNSLPPHSRRRSPVRHGVRGSAPAQAKYSSIRRPRPSPAVTFRGRRLRPKAVLVQ